MKWIKRFLIATCVLAVIGVASVAVIRHLAHSRPSWYRTRSMDQASRGAVAQNVLNKLIGVQNWVQDFNSNERNRRGGVPPGSPGYMAAPDPVKHISFSEDELNAFFQHWDDAMHWKDRYSSFISDPMLALQDRQIVLGADVKDLDMFVSVYFEPSLDASGLLRLRVAKVMGGQVKLPQLLWNGYREKLMGAMKNNIEHYHKLARMADDGSVNHAAMVAGINEMLLHALNDEAVEPVLFLRHDISHNNAMPVRLTGVSIDNNTIDMTIVPLTLDEREELVQRIREAKSLR